MTYDMPCFSCQESSSSPLNFLLNCTSCSNAWHHRCHSPPVSDKELIAIIKAFNAEKHKPAAKLVWQCGICIKAKNAVNQQNQQLIATKKATSRHVAIPHKAVVIDIDDDDDEIIALDSPSEVPKRNETSNSEVSRSSTVTQNSHPKHQSSTTASSGRVQTGRTSFTQDNKIQIIDDPFLVPDSSHRASKPSQTSSSNKPQVISGFIDLTILSDEEMNGGDDDDDVLEYVTPPPISAPPSEKVVKIVEEAPLVLTSNQTPPHPLPRNAPPTAQTSITITAPQPPNQLLTRWLNDRSTTAGVKPDLWARACLRRDQDAANRRDLGGEQSLQSAPSIPPPSRRKFKAHKLNEGSGTHSLTTFFLSAEAWRREKQASLLHIKLH